MKRLSVLIVLSLSLAACGGGSGQVESAVSPTPSVDASASAAAAAAEARRIAQNKAVAEAAAKASAAAASASAAAAAMPPDPSDFTLEIIVLRQKCFGSAGCNVTFRIDPKYTGARDAESLEVTYEVTGGDDPIINSFTIDSTGTASFDGEETVQTPSSKTQLKARVTSVRKDPTA